MAQIWDTNYDQLSVHFGSPIPDFVLFCANVAHLLSMYLALLQIAYLSLVCTIGIMHRLSLGMSRHIFYLITLSLLTLIHSLSPQPESLPRSQGPQLPHLRHHR